MRLWDALRLFQRLVQSWTWSASCCWSCIIYAFDSLKLLWRLFNAVSDSAIASGFFSTFVCCAAFNWCFFACFAYLSKQSKFLKFSQTSVVFGPVIQNNQLIQMHTLIAICCLSPHSEQPSNTVGYTPRHVLSPNQDVRKVCRRWMKSYTIIFLALDKGY